MHFVTELQTIPVLCDNAGNYTKEMAGMNRHEDAAAVQTRVVCVPTPRPIRLGSAEVSDHEVVIPRVATQYGLDCNARVLRVGA